MRNLKRALSLGLTAAMISGLMVMGSSAAGYADVTSEHNQEAIEVLQAVGVMVGDDNGNFNPDEEVTRNEMAVIMCNLLNYTASSYANTAPFTDVADWAEPYVAACWTNGITAGYDATTYGGSDTVTTAQAALMLMKALGYFQYSADFGDDWQLATISKGSTAGLYDGVSASATQTLTRNDAAQMVLNALEASMVEADGGSGVTVEGDGFTVTTGSATYNDRTSSSSDYGALDDERENNDGRYVIQLGEDLYDGDLRKSTDTDDFGRPANIWTYRSSEIGTYSDETDETWTTSVTERALYQAAGSTAYNNYVWTVYRNGDIVENGDGVELDGVDGVDVFDEGRTSTDRWQQTGNGVLTELYVDSSEETVVVSIIDTFVAEVTRVEDNGDGENTVTISYQSRPSGSVDTTYDTQQDFEDDDIVIVTVASGEIQSMAVAETVEGTVTGVSENSYVRVDGVTYNYNRAYTMDEDDDNEGDPRIGTGLVNLDDGGYTQPEVDNEVVIYLDAYGCAVAVEGAEGSVDDYLYITGLDSSYGDVSARVKPPHINWVPQATLGGPIFIPTLSSDRHCPLDWRAHGAHRNRQPETRPPEGTPPEGPPYPAPGRPPPPGRRSTAGWSCSPAGRYSPSGERPAPPWGKILCGWSGWPLRPRCRSRRQPLGWRPALRTGRSAPPCPPRPHPISRYPR